MASKRFIVSTAVNDTRASSGFLASMETYAAETGAQILLVAAKYKNPTAKRGKEKRKSDNVYDPAVVPYLTRENIKLCHNLTLFAGMPIQPTAGNPTAGLEVLCAGTSAIVGHVKRAMQVVPTSSRTPRVIWSTGAVTIAKYSNSRAGQKARQHHVLGAVIVECERDGTFFVRNVTARGNGSFIDLDRRYTPNGSEPAPNAISVVLGDIHAGKEEPASLAAAHALVKLVKPKALVLHDVLDFSSRSHHRRDVRSRYETALDLVEDEVKMAATTLNVMSKWGAKATYVARSNHDEHMERWLEEFDHRNDILNMPYWHEVSTRAFGHRRRNGSWPNLFEMEAKRLGCGSDVRFLGRNDSLKLGDVEHALHGDAGPNGSRGSIVGFTKLGCKVTVAHSHSPGVRDNVFQVGVTAMLDMGYNRRPSTWLNAHCVLHADGRRQMIIVIKGRFRAEPEHKQAKKAAR